MEKESYEVLCINKPAGATSYQQITALGYQSHDGKVYIITKDEAVEMIENEEAEFFVQVGNNEMVLQIEEKDNQKFLKIPLDNHNRDHFFSLRECKPVKSKH